MTAPVPPVVTPDAVVLDLPPARIGSRAMAWTIDAILMAALIAIALLGTGLAGSGRGPAAAIGALAVFTIFFGYPIGFETAWGRTPGKAALGLRVVTIEGTPIGFRHAAIRAVVGLVDFWVSGGSVAALSVLFTARAQRVGDLAAGTMVLGRPARRRVEPRSFTVPSGLHALAATVDVSGLTGDDYRAVRALLTRAAELPPAIRRQRAEQVLAAVAPRLAAAPPADVDAEAFLTVVAANWQARHRP